jgi:hypothetical protein
MNSKLILAAALLAAASALPIGAARADVKEAMKNACRADYERFCHGVMPGGGRIVACLQKHSSELAPACAGALAQK